MCVAIIYPIQIAGPLPGVANMLPAPHGPQTLPAKHRGRLHSGAEIAAMDKLAPNLQLLLATAWVDNHLDPSEAILLQQILTATGLNAAQIEQIMAAPPPPLDSLLSNIPDGQPREAVMRDVLRMVFSDGVLEIEEFDLIERVAQQLKLDSETVDRLRDEVSQE